MEPKDTGTALSKTSEIQVKLDEFAAEIEITEQLRTFYESVVDGSLTVQQLHRGGRDQPDVLVDISPTIHERISAARALASLVVRKPGTKPLPMAHTDDEVNKLTGEVLAEIERRLIRADEMNSKPKLLIDGEGEDDRT